MHLQPTVVLNEARLSEAVQENWSGRTYQNQPAGRIGINTVITDNFIEVPLRSIIQLSSARSSSVCRRSRWLDDGGGEVHLAQTGVQ